MPVVYIAGPFRAPDAWQREQNIRRAEELALRVWRLGAVALCPHMNTRHFDGAAPDDVFLQGDLELLRRCDAVVCTVDWVLSTGARVEVDEAHRLGIPVFNAGALSRSICRSWSEFERWLRGRT